MADDDLRFGDLEPPDDEDSKGMPDIDDAADRLVEIIRLIVILVVGYIILDALATNIFNIPLPGGI